MASARELVLKWKSDTRDVKAGQAEIKRTLDKTADDAGRSGDKAGKSFGARAGGGILAMAGKIAGPVAALFAVDKIKDFGVASVGAASDLSETLNKSNTIFGKNAAEMEKWSNTAATAFGLSKQEALGAAAGFGDMFLQLGFTGREATKNSKGIVQMAADLGSFNNLETSDVLDRIGASLRGEYDSLQAVIPNINAARVEKEALAATGKETAKQLTAEEKAQATLNIIRKDGARATGDFAKTSGGLANQQKILGSQVEDLRAKLGAKLLPISEKFFGFLNSKAVPAVSSLTDKVSGFAAGVGSGSEKLGRFGGILEGARSTLGKVSTGFGDLVAVIRPVVEQIAGKLFGAIKANLPEIQAMVGDLGTILKIGFDLLGKYYTTLARIFAKVWTVIGPTVLKILGNLIKAIVGILGGLIKIVKGIFQVLHGIFTGDTKKIREGVGNIFRGLVKIVGSLIGLLVSNVKAIFGPLRAWLMDRVGAIRAGIIERLSRIVAYVTGGFKTGMAKAREFITAPFRAGRDAAGRALTGLREKAAGFKDWIGDRFKKDMAKVRGFIGDPVRAGKDRASAALATTRTRLANLAGFAGGKFKKDFAKVAGFLAGPVRAGKDAIKDLAAKIGDIFRGLNTTVETVMGKFGAAFAKPVNAVIRQINTRLIKGGINALLAKVAGREWMQKNGVAHMKTLALRSGGGVGPEWTRQIGRIVGPGGPTEDKVPLLGSAGEHMWSAVEVARAGGHQAMERMRAAARAGQLALHGKLQKLAGGGPVQPVPGHGNRHTSGYPWASWAGDFPVGMGTPIRAWKDGIVAAVRHLTTSYGIHARMNHTDGSSSLYAHMSRVIARVGQQLDAGQTLGLVGSTGNSTGPHLHFETQGKPYSGGSGGGAGSAIGSAIGSALDFLKGLSPVEWIRDKMGAISGGGNVVASALTKLPELVLPAAKDWLSKKVSAFDVPGAANWSGAGVGGWDGAQLNNAATIISVARKLGFGDRGALIGLITAIQESTLRNLGYGDRDSVGLFQQRTPWGSRADRMNPAISATMFFKGGKGGQPGLEDKQWQSMSPGAAAQAVQVSAHPFLYAPHTPKAHALISKFKSLDTGGRLPQGLSLIHNGTGREELVLNPAQEQALLGRQQPQQVAPTVININVEGTLNDDQTIGKLIREIERYERRRGPVKIARKSA